MGAFSTSQVQAQTAGGADVDITLLKQQSLLVKTKARQKQTAASATANAHAKVDAKVLSAADTPAYPVKVPCNRFDGSGASDGARSFDRRAKQESAAAYGTGRLNFRRRSTSA
jgi:hypothetical protein